MRAPRAERRQRLHGRLERRHLSHPGGRPLIPPRGPHIGSKANRGDGSGLFDAGLDTFWLDELRYGTTAADVLIATPESDSAALLALGLALLALRAR